MDTNTLCIYISSFDGYSDVWDTFFDIFFKYWPDCPFKVYLINNSKPYTRKNCQVIHTGPEVNWFYRTIRSLEQIDEKYILFLLEDDFLSKYVNAMEIRDLVDLMDGKDIYYCRLTRAKRFHYFQPISKVPIKKRYAISLQPAVWNREGFLRLLHGIDGASPWDFEHFFMDFKNYATNDGKHIAGIRYDGRDLLGNRNGILRGKWFPDVVDYYRSEGIPIDTGRRGILSTRQLYKFRLASLASLYLPENIRKYTKKTIQKLGISYL